MKTTEQRFWEKVNKDGPTPSHCPELGPCWLWTASTRDKGYGAFVYAVENQVVQGRAHRYVWERDKGHIPVGLCVLHHCDTPACVNPAHLFLGTKADNNHDMQRKGRKVVGGTHCGDAGKYARGVHHHNAKLTEETVREMRRMYAVGGWSYGELGKVFGVNGSGVWKIIHRQRWKHVT